MTEDTNHFMAYDVLAMDLKPMMYTNITIDDFCTLQFDTAPRVASIAFLKLVPGGTIEFQVPDFGQMIALYERTMGISQRLWEAFETTGGHVWDERSIASLLLKQGFYRVWTGKVEEAPDLWMWVKAVKFNPGVGIDAPEGNHEGSPGED